MVGKKPPELVIILQIAIFAVAVGGFLITASQQRKSLNLSETAGGQLPYLREGARMAERGVTSYLGDRNRHPLMLMALAATFDEQQSVYFKRATNLAMSSAAILLIGLMVWSLALTRQIAAGGLLVAAAAWLLFLPSGSFVQAELLYYVLLFAVVDLCIRTLHAQDWKLAAAAGLTAGLAWMAKASGALLLPVAIAVFVLFGLLGKPPKRSPGRMLACAATFALGFVVVAGPLLYANTIHFGTPFYNVNSRFYMWFDRWEDAKAFSERCEPETQFPDTCDSPLPGPGTYWRTHTIGHMLSREWFGLKVQVAHAYRHPMFKYVVVIWIAVGWLSWRRSCLQRLALKRIGPGLWFLLPLTCLSLLAYGWYAQIAWGDRFVVSLLLPWLWLGCLGLEACASWRTHDFQRRLFAWLPIILALRVSLEGVLWERERALSADEPFIRFYLNESRSAERAGLLPVARRGYRGVVRLDPEFGEAWKSLGMLDLASGQVDHALSGLNEAVERLPRDSEVLNGLGAALLQADRVDEAIVRFRSAVRESPGMFPAWFNLGVARATVGDHSCHAEAVSMLRGLRPDLAKRLESWGR